MANIPAFQTELFNLFATTTNLTATEKQKLRDRFITAFPHHWQVFLADGNADTPANRGMFAAQRTMAFWQDIYRSESRRANLTTLPPDEQLT